MAVNRVLTVALILLFSLVVVQTALAAPAFTPRSDCLAGGGTWDFGSGGDDNNGTCLYPAGSAQAVLMCGPNSDYRAPYFLGSLNSDSCWPRSPGDDDSSEVLPDSQIIEPAENETDPATVSLGEDKGTVTFDPGACVTKCSVRTQLPLGAKSSLPGDAVDTMYVRMGQQENGFDATGVYTVCFKNTSGKPLVIYKFQGTVWVAQTVATDSEQVCVQTTGNGAFYLGKETTD